MKSIQYEALVEIVEEYLKICKIEGKSDATLTNYRNSMRRYLKFVRESKDVASRLQILNYLSSMDSLKPGSRNKFFRETKSFFNWAVSSGRMSSNPFDGLKNVRIPEQVRIPFSPDDVNRLLEATSGCTDREIRDKAVILMFVDTGVRLGELVGVEYQDIDFTSRRILIKKAKGGSGRIVPFADRCCDALVKYIEVRSPSLGPLFWKATPYGRLISQSPITAIGIRQAMARVGDLAQVSDVYPHRFRHTFATWAIKNNAREIDVQHILGHRSLDMIRRYTMTYRSEQAAGRHSEFSPGDQMLETRN
jgi:site-specific recombinase XerD